MPDAIELLIRGTLIGAGGAAFMDAWGLFARRTFGITGLDCALLGRWIGHFANGRFFHDRIASAEKIPAERPLGWLAHYSIGVAFAILLLLVWGLDWAHAPTIWPAMAVGVGTMVAPWFVMQPAMGAGIAGSRTPNPSATRLRNAATHVVYGIGLYSSAVAVSAAWP